MTNLLAAVTAPSDIDQLSSADRIVILTALKDAVEARLKDEKSLVIDQLAGVTEKTTSISTRGGDLTFKAPTRPMKFDDEKLLERAREVAPHLVIPRVEYDIDPELLKQLKADAVTIDVGDEVVVASKQTGEVIDYAYEGEETSASISWPASKQQKVLKAEARKMLTEHLGDVVRPMLEAPDVVAQAAAVPATPAFDDQAEF